MEADGLSFNFHTFSYKQRILSELAEVLMSGDKTTCTIEPLPDVVQCTTVEINKQSEPVSLENNQELVTPSQHRTVRKKITRRTAAKTLNQFMKYNLSLLEEESRYGLTLTMPLLKLD